jgi:hypothetical protein
MGVHIFPSLSMNVTLPKMFYTNDNERRPRSPMDIELAVAQRGSENVHIEDATHDEAAILAAMGEVETLREVAAAIRLERSRQRVDMKNALFVSRFARSPRSFT